MSTDNTDNTDSAGADASAESAAVDASADNTRTEPTLPAPPPPPPPAEGYAGAVPPAAPPPMDLPPGPTGKSGFLGGRVVRVVVGVVVVVAVTLGWTAFRNRNPTESAPDKGSCIWAEGTQSDNPKIHKVDCSDPKAQYTVLSKIKGGSESACQSVAGTEAAYIAKTSDNKPVYVLCLQQVK
jgi:hypothetical protein